MTHSIERPSFKLMYNILRWTHQSINFKAGFVVFCLFFIWMNFCHGSQENPQTSEVNPFHLMKWNMSQFRTWHLVLSFWNNVWVTFVSWGWRGLTAVTKAWQGKALFCQTFCPELHQKPEEKLLLEPALLGLCWWSFVVWTSWFFSAGFWKLEWDAHFHEGPHGNVYLHLFPAFASQNCNLCGCLQRAAADGGELPECCRAL